MIENIKRGEIYLANLNPVIGSEQSSIRPVLVIQNDIGNMYSGTTIIALITSDIMHRPEFPTHFFINSRDNLKHDSLVLLEQLRTIDKCRLIKKIVTLNYSEMIEINSHLSISIGIYL